VYELEAELVALGRSEVADPLVGPFEVVVVAEAVEEPRQSGQVVGGALVVEPFLERAVEPLELAERLWVVGSGVDQLDAGLGEAPLEKNLVAVQAAGEAEAVIGGQLARQPVQRRRGGERDPGRLTGRVGERSRPDEVAAWSSSRSITQTGVWSDSSTSHMNRK
jgi:hypothetical protein